MTLIFYLNYYHFLKIRNNEASIKSRIFQEKIALEPTKGISLNLYPWKWIHWRALWIFRGWKNKPTETTPTKPPSGCGCIMTKPLCRLSCWGAQVHWEHFSLLIVKKKKKKTYLFLPQTFKLLLNVQLKSPIEGNFSKKILWKSKHIITFRFPSVSMK